MNNLITTINFGGVNCYLLQSDTSYILVDNGYPAKRTYLEKELERAGCIPGNLKLVVLTHGDHDHAGNSHSVGFLASFSLLLYFSAKRK